MVNAYLHASPSCPYHTLPLGRRSQASQRNTFGATQATYRRNGHQQPIQQTCHKPCIRWCAAERGPQGVSIHASHCDKHRSCNASACPVGVRLPSVLTLLERVSCGLVEALAVFALVAQPLPALAGEIIEGIPRVADGDTLQIADKKIRLYGFDAPEKAQLCKNAQGADYACGLQSGDALHSMIGSNSVRCEVRNQDQYGRNVSSCSVLTKHGPVDIGNFMVSNGYAVAYRQYGKDYIAVEDAAHQAHKGMWQGSFELPADWRKDQKIDRLLASRGKSLQPQDSGGKIVAALPVPSQSSSDGPANGCKIKGNINSKGEKIYHVPGGQYYETTQIDLPQGERWFCNERQAKDAGWRAAQ